MTHGIAIKLIEIDHLKKIAEKIYNEEFSKTLQYYELQLRDIILHEITTREISIANDLDKMNHINDSYYSNC